ncbi:MAG: 50S ribosomal protein L24 [Candidatus Peregrinibacteria bacterium]|nr:50S ribosomal protein L24 [Candidatus Peregrinibacteria bacterium]
MKLRTGDTVLVISGKDKGKTGSIMRVLTKERRVIVTGINMRTRHIKKTVQGPGRKIRYEASMDISKLMFLDPKTKKPSRVGFAVDAEGAKKRVARVSGQAIEHVKGKKAERTAAPVEKKQEEKKKQEALTTEAAKTTKKPPFWKRVGFGSAAMMEEAEVTEPTHMQQDHSVPEQTVHVRKGARGS